MAAAEEGAGQVILIHSVDAWQLHLQSVKDSKKLLVVNFSAPWCGPCRMIEPPLSDLANKFPEVVFLKLDVDELQSVAIEWDVKFLPTIIFLRKGIILDKIGPNKPAIVAATNKHAAGDTSV